MEIVLLTTGSNGGGGEQPPTVLPALSLLPHLVHANVRHVGTLTSERSTSVVLVDARDNPTEARATCRTLHASGLGGPTLAVVSPDGLAALSSDWGIDDLILTSAGPAEIEARLRLAVRRTAGSHTRDMDLVRAGELLIDTRTHTARLDGRTLDLAHREFALLTFLARSPGRVFTREELMRDVWGRGHDYTGGTRTIDVHVRRLRAKFGAERESSIVTVRGVGYKFVSQPPLPVDEAGHASGSGRVVRHGGVNDHGSRRTRRTFGSRHGRHGLTFTAKPGPNNQGSRRG